MELNAEKKQRVEDAYHNGDTIVFRKKNTINDWQQDNSITFNWTEYDYRIKTIVESVPSTYDDCCVYYLSCESMQTIGNRITHGWAGKLKGFSGQQSVWWDGVLPSYKAVSVNPITVLKEKPGTLTEEEAKAQGKLGHVGFGYHEDKIDLVLSGEVYQNNGISLEETFSKKTSLVINNGDSVNLFDTLGTGIFKMVVSQDNIILGDFSISIKDSSNADFFGSCSDGLTISIEDASITCSTSNSTQISLYFIKID